MRKALRNTMQTLNHNFLRSAGLIHAELVRQACKLDSLVLAEAPWRRVNGVARSAQLAHSRGWHFAARHREEQLLREIEDLQAELGRVSDHLRQSLAPQTVPTQVDLYRDLVALESDFEEVQCDRDVYLITVTTRPIELEGMALGRFQIRLDWRLRKGSQTYTVVALDPNPAQSNDSVTHPHVSDEALCEGDGRRAIHTALAAGRLYDFFTIVDRLLHNYAPGRAYVELDNWYGTRCHDCNSTVDEDERYRCHRCEETLCGDCASYCSHCDETCCSSCSVSCPCCDGLACVGCLQTCRECRREVCPDCINHNLCTRCQNHEPEPDEVYPEDQEASPPVSTETAVQPDRLGEAPVCA